MKIDEYPNALALNIPQTAARLNLSIPTIHRMIARGELQVKRYGRRVLIPKAEVERVFREMKS